MTDSEDESEKKRAEIAKSAKITDPNIQKILRGYSALFKHGVHIPPIPKINFYIPKIPTTAPILIDHRTISMMASIGKVASNISRIFEPLRKAVQKLQKLERIGWLPHSTTPTFLMVENEEISDAELDQKISQFYAENWVTVEESISSDLNSYLIDGEAKETMQEALKAHAAGLFRCTPRLLFPEIERVVRTELYDGKLNPITSLKEFRDDLDAQKPEGNLNIGMLEISLYRCIKEHVYMNVGEDQVGPLSINPIPNRHASIHGITIYKTQKSSVNSIIIADYIFRLITTMKTPEEGASLETPDKSE